MFQVKGVMCNHGRNANDEKHRHLLDVGQVCISAVLCKGCDVYKHNSVSVVENTFTDQMTDRCVFEVWFTKV